MIPVVESENKSGCRARIISLGLWIVDALDSASFETAFLVIWAPNTRPIAARTGWEWRWTEMGLLVNRSLHHASEKLPPIERHALVDANRHELFLDTNALVKTNWVTELPDSIRCSCTVNPWMGVQEQWFSNEKFRADPHERIDQWIASFAKHGIKFRHTYATDQVYLLKRNESALRKQFSLIIPYVAIMRTLVSQRLAVNEAIKRLETLGQADIPRFTGAIMLSALCVALKKNQAFKYAGDAKPAYSFLESFLDFHPGEKDETDHMNVAYLRNRAADLNVWASLPTMRQLGYSIGSNSALVTGDKALHRVILRAIPPVMTKSHQTAFGVDGEGMPAQVFKRVSDVARTLQPRGKVSLDEQLARTKTLFGIAKSWTTDQRERAALDEVFNQWWLPGHGKKIRGVSLFYRARRFLSSSKP